MSTVTTDDDDANEADKEAELLVDPRDPRERKEPLDFELRSDALDEDDASDEFDGDERKGIEWMKLMDGSLLRQTLSSNKKRQESSAANSKSRYACINCWELRRQVPPNVLHVRGPRVFAFARSFVHTHSRTPICSRSL